MFLPPVLFWGYLASVHAVIIIDDRFHVPVKPFIAVLAAVTVMAVIDSLWRRRHATLRCAALRCDE